MDPTRLRTTADGRHPPRPRGRARGRRTGRSAAGKLTVAAELTIAEELTVAAELNGAAERGAGTPAVRATAGPRCRGAQPRDDRGKSRRHAVRQQCAASP